MQSRARRFYLDRVSSVGKPLKRRVEEKST